MKWKNVVEIISGKDQKQVACDDGKYPIYGSGGLIGYARDYLCEAGTTIVGRKGTINKPIYVNERFWNVDTAFGIFPGPLLNPKYLFYFCCYFNFSELDKSTTIPSLAKRDLLEIEMPVPSLEEQKTVVSRIEELFSQLDASEATLRTVKDQLAVYRQAVISSAYPDIPKVQWKRLDEIAEIIGGITKGRDLSKCRTIELPYLRVANVQNGYLDLSEMKTIELKEAEKEHFLLKDGDVLYTEGGDRDKLGRGTVWHNEIPECVHQNHVFKARIRDGVALPDYVSYWSMSTFARNYFFAKGKQSVNLASINKGILSALTLPVPAVKVQKEVLNSIEMRLSVCNSIVQSVDLALQQSQALRKSILNDMLKGRS